MKKVVLLSVAALVVLGMLLSVGCGGEKTELVSVEGTYEVPGEDMTIVLRADGSYVISDGPSNVGGSYEVKGDEILFEFAGVEDEKTGKLKNGTIILEGVEYVKK